MDTDVLINYKKWEHNDVPDIPGIYLFKNTINGKVYIGQANCLKTRLNQHKTFINDGLYFHNALLKYGLDNFEYYILEVFTDLNKDAQNESEKYFIKKFKSNNPQFGYNLTEGGDGHLGAVWTEEQKEIRSQLTRKLFGKYCIAYNYITKEYVEANSRAEMADILQGKGYLEINEQRVHDVVLNNSRYTGDYLIANTLEELQEKINTFVPPKKISVYLYNYKIKDEIKEFNSVAEAEHYIKKFNNISPGHLHTAVANNSEHVKDFLFATTKSELLEKIENFSEILYFFNIEDRYIITFKSIADAVKHFKNIGISCNPSSFGKVKAGKQISHAGFIVGKNKKDLLNKICSYTKESADLVSKFIIDNELTNSQEAISWADELNEVSVRF